MPDATCRYYGGIFTERSKNRWTALVPGGIKEPMDFKTYYLGLDPAEREPFAKSLGTSTGYCLQLCYADKKIELGFADVVVAKTKGKVKYSELPLTDRARKQIKARKWDADDQRQSPAYCCGAAK
jgi:hypothetical protein